MYVCCYPHRGCHMAACRSQSHLQMCSLEGRLNASVDEQGLTACRIQYLTTVLCTQHAWHDRLAGPRLSGTQQVVVAALFVRSGRQYHHGKQVERNGTYSDRPLSTPPRAHPCSSPGRRFLSSASATKQSSRRAPSLPHQTSHVCILIQHCTCPSLLSAAGRTVNCWL